MSRRTVALSVNAGKLTARTLAQTLQWAGRKIAQERRAHKTPHGKQTVAQLMAHGEATSSIPVDGPKDFDRVARKWNVDYAFYESEPGKYLLFFKSKQAGAITACFSEYSRQVLNKGRSRRVPIREQLKRAADRVRRQPKRENGVPAKSADFVGRGGATERADFGGKAAEGAERSLHRRREVEHER